MATPADEGITMLSPLNKKPLFTPPELTKVSPTTLKLALSSDAEAPPMLERTTDS